jgi:outer membrane receptor protein involved in Fe transport
MRGHFSILVFNLFGVCLAFSAADLQSAQQDSNALVLEEVIVTAEKRGAENLQDLAMSAAVISSAIIEDRNLVGMDDYLRSIPSVSYQEYGAGRTTTIIRGITADPQEGVETTGTYINETSLTNLGLFGTSSPELKLVDVNRVEILRGPQGTLYGASSLGGTVRIITERPRLDAFGASVSGAISYTGGEGSWNGSGEGVLNIPLIEDQLAVRAVAYHYDYSGYYRNIAASDPVKSTSAANTGALALDRNDVGSSTFSGARIALRWEPTEQLSADLMYLKQEIEQEGVAYGDLELDKFTQARYTRLSTGRSEFHDDDLSMLSLILEYDAGSFGLVSSSSWNEYDTRQDWDVGKFWTFLYDDDAPIFIQNTTQSESFVQEVRVVSQWDRKVNFLVGAYYEDLQAPWYQLVEWDGNPMNDPFGGELLAEGSSQYDFSQLAFFGEVAWDVSDRLIATAGMRHFNYDTAFRNEFSGLVYGGEFEESQASEEDGNSYKLNLSYAHDERSLYYIQWAQGFKPGYALSSSYPPNCDSDGDGLIDGIGLPPQDQVNSDSLDSYEIGSKLSLAGGRVNLRAAAFYNEWDQIPILLVAECAYGFEFNAGEAMTRGVEFEGSAQVSDRLRLDFSFGYLKGELTEDAPGLGMDGDRLPGAPEYNAALGLQYDFSWRTRDTYLRADLATVGGYYNNLQEQGQKLGDYTTINLSGGLRLGDWDIQVFIQNLTDEDAATWIYRFEEYPSAYRLRPRTIGASLRYTFGEI